MCVWGGGVSKRYIINNLNIIYIIYSVKILKELIYVTLINLKSSNLWSPTPTIRLPTPTKYSHYFLKKDGVNFFYMIVTNLAIRFKIIKYITKS